tara:strand:- start:448 stop:1056 length:609 start_codon:yes stop_codon:yes gene_type:complete
MIKNKLKQNAKNVDDFLKKILKKERDTNLLKVMKYGTLSGGKKIRSSIIIFTGKLFNLSKKKMLNICAAVECIHSYSLMHDDLPCMDNDRIRRGKPSAHIRYGEADAVLAGSSLLTLAFEMIASKNYSISNTSKLELIKELANCSGHTGIAGGQQLDLSFENKKKSLKQIIDMQKKKLENCLIFVALQPELLQIKIKKKKKS